MVNFAALICNFIFLIPTLAVSSGYSLLGPGTRREASYTTECVLEGEGWPGQPRSASLVQRHAAAIGVNYKSDHLTEMGIGKRTQPALEISPALAKSEVPFISPATQASRQSTQEFNSVDAEVRAKLKRQSGQLSKLDQSSIMYDLLQLLHGRPKLRSVFIMMLLPAGICTIMYCFFNVISSMEETAAHSANEGRENPRTMLGDEMQRSLGSKRGHEPLCQELLAPSDNYCVIALPSLVRDNLGASMIERMVLSKTGSPIVRITFACVSDGMPDVAGGAAGSGQSLERISLISYRRQNALGFCELQFPSASQPMSCCMYRPSGELFATLAEDSTGAVSSLLASGSCALLGAPTFGAKCYMLTTVATAARFWIRGDFINHNLEVVSEIEKDKAIIKVDSGQQLKFKGDLDNHYRLRVQPKVDAGVVIMALLAIDRLPESYRM